jgi:(1->4)-alpha-D-glucan 1-alpha-D-glucosylmutase
VIEKPIFVPTSTYRLQVHHAFPLTAARDVVPYLARLGVHACYTSPYFTAAPASTHGYDVVNHNEINPEVGGTEAHDEFSAVLARYDMRHVVDFVPNHMGVGTGRNTWWNDVLENGPSSPAAGFFDIDWRPVKAKLQAKLLLPILGDQYGNVLERGELRIAFTGSSLVLKYFDQELPINPHQAARVYAAAADRLKVRLGEETPSLNEFLSIVASLQNLPPYTTTDPDQIAELHREKEVARTRLERLVTDEPAVLHAIEGAIEEINGIPGQPASFDALHELLEAQPYRLAYWRTASHEINYRRFFDINTLVGLRAEREEVFEATHQLLAQLIAEGKVHAVRVDHPDGLFDPQKYFCMLQSLAARALGLNISARDSDRPIRPLYVVAEKILSGSERLPQGWPVHGTTGYNFLHDLNGLFVDTAQARRMRRVYAKVTGHSEPFDDVLYASKRLIMGTAMASELNVLSHTLERIGESNRKSRDFTLDSLRDVITEFIACFPVYRTYVDERGWTTEDRAVVVRAIARARRRNPAMESSLFDFLREVVLPRDVHDDKGEPPAGIERRGGYPPADEYESRERLRFSMKLQQYTGPVQAKGLEDTAFYRYNVLLSLNEVGGDPSRFGRSVEEFHEANRLRAEVWPFEMLATATHDTKLGEDVRARINVLSEIPDEWGRDVSKWMRIAKAQRTLVDGEPAPDRTDEYRFYQALIGVWPPDLDVEAKAAPAELVTRLSDYMIKAVKEAKVHTSWLTPNEPYEEALRTFVRRVLTGSSGAKLLTALLPFQRKVAHLGMINSLAQVTLKIGSPGVPDFYQGTDLWDLSLVDPDNRRPVDFDQRIRALNEVDAALTSDPDTRSSTLRDWLEHWADGRIKMMVTGAGLRLRRELEDVFLGGDYLPVPVELTVPGGIVAFARLSRKRDHAVLFVAPRLFSRLVTAGQPLPLGAECWKTSRLMLPPDLRDRQFRDEMTGVEIRPTRAGENTWIFIGEALQTLPVAILRAV